MRGKRLLALLAASSFFGCGTKSGTEPAVSVAELKSQHDSGVEMYVVDVRTQAEFNEGHLEFTDDLIPYDQVDEHLAQLPDDKDALIYCFCRSGRRSGITANVLRSNGFNNVFNVEGGIIAWKEAGYPVVTDSSP
ncbi:MAG: rhodanese-like domain-containing protein [bacterium]|nr:rhodanese-like domain-containing protein [bacterium]